jgi:probable phosphoglycerate mutase
MKEEFLNLLTAWEQGQYEASIAGGESAQDMWDRLSSFVEQLKRRPEERLLICSHGRAMRCLMTVLRDDAISNMKNYHHANTGLYLVDYTPDIFKFQLQNDLSHLALITDR